MSGYDYLAVARAALLTFLNSSLDSSTFPRLVPRIVSQLYMSHFIRIGDSETVIRYINEGLSVNKTLSDGTMLMIAAKHSQWEIAKLLIDRGADLYKTMDNSEWNVLHYAAMNSWLPFIQICIEKKFSLDVKTANQETALIIAALWNRKDVVTLLVENGANINARDVKKYTALQHAAYQGHMDIVKYLVQNKADVNAVSRNERPPFLAVLNRNRLDTELICGFIRAGADCNFKYSLDMTPFSFFCRRKLLQAIFESIERGAYMAPSDYIYCVRILSLQYNVLNKVKYCSQLFINEYNNKDLPELYKEKMASDMLPAIEFMKIKDSSGIASEIDRVVEKAIERNGYCNLLKLQPLSLSIKCVKAFLEHVKNPKIILVPTNLFGNGSGLKRSSVPKYFGKKVCSRKF